MEADEMVYLLTIIRLDPTHPSEEREGSEQVSREEI